MGDYDAVGLPIHHQSGVNDIGQVSFITQDLEGDRALQLETITNNYYSGDINGNDFQDEIRRMGFSREQQLQLVSATQTENTLRRFNPEYTDGTELSANQLTFLNDNLNMQELHHLQILTGEGGRRYYADRRSIQDDGTPARIYLPAPLEFDVLTPGEREEADERGQIVEDIRNDMYGREGATGDIVDDFTEEQRRSMSDLTTTYLNSGKTRADLLQFRNNIQEIEGIENVMRIDNKLYQFFLDVDYEAEYRDDHNGLGQLITQEQYDFMRQNNRNYGFTGQPILHTPDGTKYFFSNGNRLGKVPLPPEEYIEGMNALTYGNLDIQMTNEDSNLLTEATTSYLTDNISAVDLDNYLVSITDFNPNDRTRDPYRHTQYAIGLQLVNTAIQEKQFRDLNDGRPSQLTPLQYEYLMNHTLAVGGAESTFNEPRYDNSLIGTNDKGLNYFNFVNDINQQPNQMIIPTEDIINQQIENGIYVRPGQEIPDRPAVNIPGAEGLGEPHDALPNIDPADLPNLDLDPHLPVIPLPVVPPNNIYTELGRADRPPENPLLEGLDEAIDDLQDREAPDIIDLTNFTNTTEIDEPADDLGRTIAGIIGAGIGMTRTGERLLESTGQPLQEFLQERKNMRDMFFERQQLRDEYNTQQVEYVNVRDQVAQKRVEMRETYERFNAIPKPPASAGRPSRAFREQYATYYNAKAQYDRELNEFSDLSGENFLDRYRSAGGRGSRPRPVIQNENGRIPVLNRQIEQKRTRIENIEKTFKMGENPETFFTQQQIQDTQIRTRIQLRITQLESQPVRTVRDNIELVELRENIQTLPISTLLPQGIRPDPTSTATGESMEERLIVNSNYGFVESAEQVAEGTRVGLNLLQKGIVGQKLGVELYDEITGAGILKPIIDTAGLYLGYGETVDLTAEEQQPLERPINMPIYPGGYYDLNLNEGYNTQGYKGLVIEKTDLDLTENNNKSAGYIDLRNIIDEEVDTFLPDNTDIPDINDNSNNVYNNNRINNIQEIVSNSIENSYEPPEELWNINDIISGCSVDECPKNIKTLKNQYEENHKNPSFRPIYNNTNGRKQTDLDRLIHDTSSKSTADVMKSKGYLFDGTYNRVNKKYKGKNEKSDNGWKINKIE